MPIEDYQTIVESCANCQHFSEIENSRGFGRCLNKKLDEFMKFENFSLENGPIGERKEIGATIHRKFGCILWRGKA